MKNSLLISQMNFEIGLAQVSHFHKKLALSHSTKSMKTTKFIRYLLQCLCLAFVLCARHCFPSNRTVAATTAPIVDDDDNNNNNSNNYANMKNKTTKRQNKCTTTRNRRLQVFCGEVHSLYFKTVAFHKVEKTGNEINTSWQLQFIRCVALVLTSLP